MFRYCAQLFREGGGSSAARFCEKAGRLFLDELAAEGVFSRIFFVILIVGINLALQVRPGHGQYALGGGNAQQLPQGRKCNPFRPLI
jgi:hypothetical protein